MNLQDIRPIFNFTSIHCDDHFLGSHLENTYLNDITSVSPNEVIIPSESTSDKEPDNESILNLDLFEDVDIDIDFLMNDDINEINPSQDFHLTDLLDVGKNEKSRKKPISLLPFSVQDLKHKNKHNSSNLNNEDLSKWKAGERVRLSEEEKRLLIRDGYRIPTHFPLTKTEERILKSIRRKIRNKLSAKNSRAKKANYVEGLEIRISQYLKENNDLKQKLSACEKEKSNLYHQVINLQKQLSKFLLSSPASATSLMLLLLTFMLIFSPFLDPRQLLFKSTNSVDKPNFLPGRTRVLLEVNQTHIEQNPLNMLNTQLKPPLEIPINTTIDMLDKENIGKSKDL